jgi:hypothetical protein
VTPCAKKEILKSYDFLGRHLLLFQNKCLKLVSSITGSCIKIAMFQHFWPSSSYIQVDLLAESIPQNFSLFSAFYASESCKNDGETEKKPAGGGNGSGRETQGSGPGFNLKVCMLFSCPI